MNSKTQRIVSAAVAATLGLGSVGAFAQNWQGRDRDRDGVPDRYEHRDNGRHNGWENRDRDHDGIPNRYDRYDNRYVQPAPAYRAPQYYGYNAPAQVYGGHRWQRGQYLPYEYRRNYAVVNNWGAYNLYAPPAGYQWVRADTGDYLLVALATGLIANLLLSQ
jgi:Ni/Co efflux regulator RcnB